MEKKRVHLDCTLSLSERVSQNLSNTLISVSQRCNSSKWERQGKIQFK